jgi:hypothetical protein
MDLQALFHWVYAITMAISALCLLTQQPHSTIS